MQTEITVPCPKGINIFLHIWTLLRFLTQKRKRLEFELQILFFPYLMRKRRKLPEWTKVFFLESKCSCAWLDRLASFLDSSSFEIQFLLSCHAWGLWRARNWIKKYTRDFTSFRTQKSSFSSKYVCHIIMKALKCKPITAASTATGFCLLEILYAGAFSFAKKQTSCCCFLNWRIFIRPFSILEIEIVCPFIQ